MILTLLIITALAEPCNLKLDYSVEEATCENSASLAIQFSGGCGPYLVYVNDILLKKAELPHEVFLPEMAQGLHMLKILDGNSCVITREVAIKPAVGLQVTGRGTPSTGNDGTVQLEITGKPPFAIRWLDVSGNRSRNRSDLVPGTYTAVVKDRAGCSSTISIDVDPVELPLIPEEDNDGDDVMIDASTEEDSDQITAETSLVVGDEDERLQTDSKRTRKRRRRPFWWIFPETWGKGHKGTFKPGPSKTHRCPKF